MPDTFYGYVIKDTQKGDIIVKNGISGQPLNKNGSSPRANQQVNELNKLPGNEGRYKAEVDSQVPEGPGARQAALEAEQAVSNQNRDTLDPAIHQKP